MLMRVEVGGGRLSPGQVPGGSSWKALGALLPGHLPHQTGSAFDWAARRHWSFSPPSGGVVSYGKSGSHRGVSEGAA